MQVLDSFLALPSCMEVSGGSGSEDAGKECVRVLGSLWV